MASGTIFIDEERCKGCQLCTIACPQNVLVIDKSTLNAKGYHPAKLVDFDAVCTGCAVCAVICPDVCITVYRQSRVRRSAAD